MSFINIFFGVAYGFFNQHHIYRDILGYLNGISLVGQNDPLILKKEKKGNLLDIDNKDFVLVGKN